MAKSIFENELQNQADNEAFNEDHLMNLLQHADQMLDMTLPGIAVKYADQRFQVIQCHEKGEINEYIEVRFNNEGADLVCEFDAEKKCEKVSIFIDQLDDCLDIYKDYIRHLNLRYMHVEEQYCWKMPQGVLALMVEKDRLYLSYFRGLEVPTAGNALVI